MLKIPRKQVLDRWDSLSDNMREALCSEQNANILWKFCEAQHLSQDKIGIVAVLVGDVILGFTHPEDLTQEIRNELGLNQVIADAIAAEVDRKIFGPIRSELEKVYAPPTNEIEKEEALDLRKKTEISGKLIETDRNLIKTETGAPAELPELIITETPLKPVETKEIKAETPKSIETKKFIETKETVGDEGPMIIHKEAEFKSQGDTAKKSLGGFFGFLKNGKTEPTKPSAVKAEVKLDGNSEAASVEPAPPRVVHYSEFSTPIKTEIPLKPVETKEIKIEARPPENLPAVSPVELPAVSPSAELRVGAVEPRVVSRVEPPAVIEKPVANQVKPPIPPIPKKSSSFWNFLKIKKPVKIEPPIKLHDVEPPQPKSAKPDENIIDLSMFK